MLDLTSRLLRDSPDLILAREDMEEKARIHRALDVDWTERYRLLEIERIRHEQAISKIHSEHTTFKELEAARKAKALAVEAFTKKLAGYL